MPLDRLHAHSPAATNLPGSVSGHDEETSAPSSRRGRPVHWMYVEHDGTLTQRKRWIPMEAAAGDAASTAPHTPHSRANAGAGAGAAGRSPYTSSVGRASSTATPASAGSAPVAPPTSARRFSAAAAEIVHTARQRASERAEAAGRPSFPAELFKLTSAQKRLVKAIPPEDFHHRTRLLLFGAHGFGTLHAYDANWRDIQQLAGWDPDVCLPDGHVPAWFTATTSWSDVLGTFPATFATRLCLRLWIVEHHLKPPPKEPRWFDAYADLALDQHVLEQLRALEQRFMARPGGPPPDSLWAQRRLAIIRHAFTKCGANDRQALPLQHLRESFLFARVSRFPMFAEALDPFTKQEVPWDSMVKFFAECVNAEESAQLLAYMLADMGEPVFVS